MGSAQPATRERKGSAEKVRLEAGAHFAHLYGQLNAEQRQAVDAIEGPVMVLAGPGTGKTQTLAMRIANILQQTQMDPWNILCLTFTESGVAAMRERLISIIGTPAYYVRIHTFHSFCNDIIQEHPELFARSRTWEPLADVERLELFEYLLDALPGTSPLKPFGNSYLYLKDIAGNVQALKQEDISPEQFKDILAAMSSFAKGSERAAREFFALRPKDRTAAACQEIFEQLQAQAKGSNLPPSLVAILEDLYTHYTTEVQNAESAREAGKVRTAFKQELKKWLEKMTRTLPRHQDMQRVYAQYQQELEQRGRYDFEDMIIMVIEELKKNTDLLAEYQEQFQYILVDEYQDTNGAQNEVVALLSSYDVSPNVFVVGDDKQSIYRFQGASLHNMLDFYHRHAGAVQVVTLRNNYRSQENVLRAAHQVIAHNEESIAKYIPTVVEELAAVSQRRTERFAAYVAPSEETEVALIGDRIEALIANGSEPQDIAVLFRYNRDGQELYRHLRVRGISARLEAGENALDDTMVNQWLALLDYIHDGTRDDALADVLHYDWLHLSAIDVVRAVRYAGMKRRDLFGVISTPEELQAAGVAEPDRFVAFAHQLATWRALRVNTTLQNFFTTVLTESGLIDYITASRDHLGSLQKLSTLLNEVKTISRGNPQVTFAEFIQRLTLLRRHSVPLQTEPWQAADNAVRLMTAHKAKGLEFEHVFITHVNDKHWGNNREPNTLPLPHGLVRYDYVLAQKNNEDERRLFYVALTRAKQSVTLTRARRSSTGRPVVPSIFWNELPPEVVDTHEIHEDQAAAGRRLVETVLRPLPALQHGELNAWLTQALKGYTMSVTHLNNYLDCPRKFYIRNVLYVPSARTKHQAMGTAVHEALNDFCRKFNDTGKLPQKSELLALFEAYLSREVLTHAEAADVRDTGRLALGGYYDHYQDTLCRHAVGEYDFRSHGAVVPLPDGGAVPITGKIDKMELIDEADVQKDGRWKRGAAVNVVDYKTGDPEKGMRKLKVGGSYHRQLVFYKLLCDESPRFAFTMTTGEIDFIQPSEKKGFVKKKLIVTDSDVNELKETIARVWGEIQALKFLEDNAACGKCEYCA